VDVVGLSILSGAHLTLCPRVREEMDKRGLEALWIVGGNVPRCDHQALRDMGVDAVFNTGTPFEAITSFIEERVAR